MMQITLDAELRKRLGNLQQPIELCDETGRVVGRLFPAADLSEYDLTEPPLDMEEVRRQLNEEPRYTTKQVLEHLENLCCSELTGRPWPSINWLPYGRARMR